MITRFHIKIFLTWNLGFNQSKVWIGGTNFLKTSAWGDGYFCSQRGGEATFWGKHLPVGPPIFPEQF